MSLGSSQKSGGPSFRRPPKGHGLDRLRSDGGPPRDKTAPNGATRSTLVYTLTIAPGGQTEDVTEEVNHGQTKIHPAIDVRIPARLSALHSRWPGVGSVGGGAGAAQDVQVSVLTQFAPGMSPTAVAATNTGDVVAQVGPNLISVGPNGQQKQKIAATISGGPLGPAGVAYDRFHQLYVALPESTAPPPHGTILKISRNGKQATPVPGSEGMVAPDGFGLDSATGDLYVTDIFGNSIWRIPPGGSAQLFTSVATNPLLVLPDGVKVFNNAVFTSLEGGKILRIPINPDGSAGTAQVFAQVNDPGVFFDDMTLDDRTGDVYVSRLDTNELLQITPGGAITPIATHADGLLGAANMSLIHVGQSTVIYLANQDVDIAESGQTGGAGPAILKITIK